MTKPQELTASHSLRAWRRGQGPPRTALATTWPRCGARPPAAAPSVRPVPHAILQSHPERGQPYSGCDLPSLRYHGEFGNSRGRMTVEVVVDVLFDGKDSELVSAVASQAKGRQLAQNYGLSQSISHMQLPIYTCLGSCSSASHRLHFRAPPRPKRAEPSDGGRRRLQTSLQVAKQ